MSERRRFNGPESSVKPIFSSESYPIPTCDSILNTETLTRPLDGDRFPEQMRSLSIRPNIINQAMGSCYIEVGNTKLTCAVYGPRGTGKIGKTFLELGNIACDFDLLPFASEKRRPYQREADEQEMSKLLQETLETVVIRESFPNSVVDVYVNVLEDDGGVLAASITAASIALTLAGIQMFDSVVGCSIACTSTTSLLDPSLIEQSLAPSRITLALHANSGEVAQICLKGAVEDVVLREALNLATDGCAVIYEQVKQAINLASNQQ